MLENWILNIEPWKNEGKAGYLHEHYFYSSKHDPKSTLWYMANKNFVWGQRL